MSVAVLEPYCLYHHSSTTYLEVLKSILSWVLFFFFFCSWLLWLFVVFSGFLWILDCFICFIFLFLWIMYGYLIGIALNPYISFGIMVIFILILPIHEHEMFFHFIVPFSIFFFRELKFSLQRSFASLVRFILRFYCLWCYSSIDWVFLIYRYNASLFTNIS